MSHLAFNGKTLLADQLRLAPENRAFRYGDGFFESIRLAKGNIPFLDSHFKRIMVSLEVLKLEQPKGFSAQNLLELSRELCDLDSIGDNARIRATFFRQSGGKYEPLTSSSDYLIEAEDLPSATFELNEKGLHVGIYEDIRKADNKLSALKTNNALIYIMANIQKQEMGLDDMLIMNEAGRICEGSSSNLFYSMNDRLYTPPLSENCVAGVMRQELLKMDGDIHERSLNIDDLANCEDLFLTNASGGIQWVAASGSSKFDNAAAVKMNERLNELVLQ
ncbi:MAG: aminotransferase class IV [Bacteroidetes bacterium]|nr:aminotransferase class IV [Bacteroidota bacterium]